MNSNRRCFFFIISQGCKIDMSFWTVRLLQEVLETVKRRGSSSYIKAVFNAADRDFEITMLERRLLDSRIDILVGELPMWYAVITQLDLSYCWERLRRRK